MFNVDDQSNLTLVVRDQVGRFLPLPNDRGSKITNGTNGYESADWTLDREFGFAWDDQGLNNQVFYYTGFGDTIFHGRLDSLTPKWEDGIISLGGSAKGYKDSATDLKFNGQLAGTPEARIAALITGGYLPQLVNDTSGLISTGLAAGSTNTDNSGTDDMSPWDIILNICKLGTSAGYKVVPQVWNDRKLITKAINTLTPTPRYIVDRANVKSISLARTLSDIFTQVEVRYKDSVDGTLQRLVLPASTSAIATALGIDFDGLGTVVPFLRTKVLDISSTYPDGTSSAVATAAGNALLNEEQRTSNTSDSIVIEQDYVIFDTLEGQEIPNYKLRGDDWIQINGFTPWPTETGTGTSAGDQAITSMFLMTAAEWDKDSGTLTITPESAGDLASAITERLGGSIV
jgi:hypothetical protein